MSVLPPCQITPSAVGEKFHASGQVRTFPGNTIVCHIANQPVLLESFEVLYQRLRKAKAAHCYTLLPPSSWHMTVFEGVCDDIRQEERWPADIALNAWMDQVHAAMQHKLSALPFPVPQKFTMKISGFWPMRVGIVMALAPATPDDESALRQLRDALARHLGMRRPDHASYPFHITLAYFTAIPDTSQYIELFEILTQESEAMARSLQPFTLAPPEFCRFNDMFAFAREFYLGR